MHTSFLRHKVYLGFLSALVTIGGLFLFTNSALAVDTIDMNVINKTEIRTTEVRFTETDLNNADVKLRVEYGRGAAGVTALNEALAEMYGDLRFFDSDIWDGDHDWRASVTRGEKTCENNQIEVLGEAANLIGPPSNRQGFRVTLKIPAGDDCVTATTDGVNASNEQNLTKAFKWINETRIQTYQDDIFFDKSDNDPRKYTRVDEDDTTCTDNILLNIGVGDRGETFINYGAGKWSELANNRGSSSVCNFDDPWDIKLDGDGGQTPYDILIADVENRALPPGTTPDDPNGGGSTEETCEDQMAEEGGFGWILCPVLQGIDDVSNVLLSSVDDMLTLKASDFNDPDGNLREAWSYFRNIASLALIIIGLIMVIGQATSRE